MLCAKDISAPEAVRLSAHMFGSILLCLCYYKNPNANNFINPSRDIFFEAACCTQNILTFRHVTQSDIAAAQMLSVPLLFWLIQIQISMLSSHQRPTTEEKKWPATDNKDH